MKKSSLQIKNYFILLNYQFSNLSVKCKNRIINITRSKGDIIGHKKWRLLGLIDKSDFTIIPPSELTKPTGSHYEYSFVLWSQIVKQLKVSHHKREKCFHFMKFKCIHFILKICIIYWGESKFKLLIMGRECL